MSICIKPCCKHNICHLFCLEEVSNVDEITDEESIGMNLEYKTENKDMLSLAVRSF